MQDSVSSCPNCQSPIPPDAPGGICPACALLGVAGSTDPTQAADAHMPTLEEVAAAFPELELVDLIGQGGMGIVFKARQPRIERFVALKILPPKLAAQPGFAARFTREARALAMLAHPHIVAVYDFGERAGFYYLLMEFVNGVNLRQAMRAGVTPEQALLLVPRVCEALQFAHDHGVLHRDIKPENILLDTAGTPKLADFGIAKLADDPPPVTGLTQTGAQLGTAAYMAPEQIEKPATVDHRADIYSLGVVLYEMLTGELPIGRFAAPSEKSHVGRGVDEVVLRALEKERERRQQSATEMKTEVEHVSRAAAPQAIAASADVAPNPWPSRLFWLIASLLVLPLVSIFSWLLVPRLTMIGDDLGTRSGGWAVALAALLPFIAGGALFFFYRRTLPGVDRATPRAAWNPWPKRIFLLILVLVVLPTMLAGLGLVLPWVAYRSLQRPAPQSVKLADVVTATRAPFIAHLPQGTVEFVAVAPHPSPGQPWWRMDGAPASEGPFLNTGAQAFAQSGERAWELVIRTHGLPPGSSGPFWQIDDCQAWSGGETPSLVGNPDFSLAGYHLVAATMPRSLGQTNVRAGFASGDWKTIHETDPRNSSGVSFSREGEQWTLAAGSAIETKDGDVVVTFNSGKHPEFETRVVAQLASGELKSGTGSSVNQQSEWRFRGTPLASIAKFHFQVRRVSWVEFRGVRLAPLATAQLAPGDAFEDSVAQEKEIRLRREQHEAMKQRHAVGVVTSLDVAATERDLAIAEARSDAVRIAKAKVRYAETKLRTVQQQNMAGMVEAEYVRAATLELNAARSEETRALRAMNR